MSSDSILFRLESLERIVTRTRILENSQMPAFFFYVFALLLPISDSPHVRHLPADIHPHLSGAASMR